MKNKKQLLASDRVAIRQHLHTLRAFDSTEAQKKAATDKIAQLVLRGTRLMPTDEASKALLAKVTGELVDSGMVSPDMPVGEAVKGLAPPDEIASLTEPILDRLDKLA